MKRFVSILLSSFLLVLSVPVIPAKSAPLYLTGDQAYEIYLSILSLIETGRLASGYDNSIFSSNFADFQSNIAEINSYLATHSSQLNGIDFYWNDGSSALKEDWVDEDWDLDGDGIADTTGTLSNKLSVLTQDKIDELENFNSGMNNNSFNEDNNNPFSLLKKVALGVGALAGVTFATLADFTFDKNSGEIQSINPPDIYYTPTAGSYALNFYGVGIYGQSNIYVNNKNPQWMVTEPTAYYDVSRKETNYFYSGTNSRGYYIGASGYAYFKTYNVSNGSWSNNYNRFTAFDMFSFVSMNLPYFNSRADALNYFFNGVGQPLNLAPFDFASIHNKINDMFLPLIDTQLRPYGFIGLNNGLSSARQNLNLSSEPADNSDLWIIEVPDIIDDILPDYVPDYDPIPAPDPLPDPDPIPDPEPDPEPEPDPDPDIGDPIVDDEGDLTEIPIIQGLQGRFPFSIPWDIKHLISNLSAEREAPSFEYDFYISPRWLPPNGFIYHFEIDLSSFDYLASLFRRLFLLSFIIGLAVYSYAKFFGGGE